MEFSFCEFALLFARIFGDRNMNNSEETNNEKELVEEQTIATDDNKSVSKGFWSPAGVETQHTKRTQRRHFPEKMTSSIFFEAPENTPNPEKTDFKKRRVITNQ